MHSTPYFLQAKKGKILDFAPKWPKMAILPRAKLLHIGKKSFCQKRDFWPKMLFFRVSGSTKTYMALSSRFEPYHLDLPKRSFWADTRFPKSQKWPKNAFFGHFRPFLTKKGPFWSPHLDPLSISLRSPFWSPKMPYFDPKMAIFGHFWPFLGVFWGILGDFGGRILILGRKWPKMAIFDPKTR